MPLIHLTITFFSNDAMIHNLTALSNNANYVNMEHVLPRLLVNNFFNKMESTLYVN